MKTNVLTVAVFAFAIITSFAESEEGLGRWTFSAGPAWRSQTKMRIRGSAFATPVSTLPSVKWDRYPMNNSDDWDTPLGQYDVSAYSGVDGDKAWGTTATRTVVTVNPGSGVGSAFTSEDDSALGLRCTLGYDFYRGETLSVGLGLSFAGYWNQKARASGSVNAGSVTTTKYTDLYLFLADPLAYDAAYNLSNPEPTPGSGSFPDTYEAGAAPISGPDEVFGAGTRNFSPRLRSDLYQIGLGPKVTWSPFVGWCDSLSWLDVYGGVEVLCNIAQNEFDADGHSSSQTDCLLGFGGNVGLVGNITDNIGIYGQVGYEWIDDTDVSTGGFKADVDYSSLVLSAGVQVRF